MVDAGEVLVVDHPLADVAGGDQRPLLGAALVAHGERGEGHVDLGLVGPQAARQRQHGGGHVGSAGAGGEQQIAHPKTEVQGEGELAGLRHSADARKPRAGTPTPRRVDRGWVRHTGGVRIDFAASPEPTLGVEWEFALVDRRTRDLRNDAAHLFARAKARLPDPGRLHKELLRNTVEVVTGVCHTVDEAMTDLRRDAGGGGAVRRRARASTCTARARTRSRRGPQQELTEGHRYEELINRTQWWGRQMLIWGVHVHVGMPDRVAGDAGADRAAALLPAPAGALGVLADLGRGRHRLRVEPGADVPAAADRRAAVPLRDLGGVRGVRRRPASRPG